MTGFGLVCFIKTLWKTGIPVFGWYRSRKTGTASCIRLWVCGNKKAGVCCNRKHRLHAFFYVSEGSKDLRSERVVFCSRNSPRSNNSPENNKKNRMQKDSSSGSSYLLFSSLKITAGSILSGCWSYHSAVGRICQQENSISWSFTLLCNKGNSCYSKVTEFAMISTHRSIPSVPLFKQRS